VGHSVFTLRFFCALASVAVLAAAIARPSAPLRADEPAPALIPACRTGDPAMLIDDLSGFIAPCAQAPGMVAIETLYFQNASSVGESALAAYPLFRVRTGIVRRLEAVLDTPSQIAESGPHGTGLYPTTHLGYGVNYTFLADGRAAGGMGIEMLPPDSRFVTTAAQPKYVVDVTMGYHLGDRTTLSAIATGASSRSVGFQRIFPTVAVRTAYDASAVTQISTDLGERVVARHSSPQTFGDVAVNERLHKNLHFSVGLGTTFNPVSDAKAHYLASGFDVQL
jgi:hypothetical protein